MEGVHMSYKILKPKKMSLYDFTKKYANNPINCVGFFYTMKWPGGFSCDRCQCHEYWLVKRTGKTKVSYVLECKQCHKQHSLLSGTIFQSCKLDLYKLLLGIFLFFNENKGISAITLMSHLDINYKSALLLETKCRILMSLSNSQKLLESSFYEADVFNVGSKSKNKPGRASEQQSVLGILSTDQENAYPSYIKLRLTKDYTGATLKTNIEKYCVLSKEAVLNTDGEKGFNVLKDQIQVKNEKISYNEPDHRLKWLNIIIGNIKNNITGIYHGVTKREMPLFMNEQEYRFNHRYTGKYMMDKVKEYLQRSFPITHKQIVYILNISTPYFASTC